MEQNHIKHPAGNPSLQGWGFPKAVKSLNIFKCTIKVSQSFVSSILAAVIHTIILSLTHLQLLIWFHRAAKNKSTLCDFDHLQWSGKYCWLCFLVDYNWNWKTVLSGKRLVLCIEESRFLASVCLFSSNTRTDVTLEGASLDPPPRPSFSPLSLPRCPWPIVLICSPNCYSDSAAVT